MTLTGVAIEILAKALPEKTVFLTTKTARGVRQCDGAETRPAFQAYGYTRGYGFALELLLKTSDAVACGGHGVAMSFAYTCGVQVVERLLGCMVDLFNAESSELGRVVEMVPSRMPSAVVPSLCGQCGAIAERFQRSFFDVSFGMIYEYEY